MCSPPCPPELSPCPEWSPWPSCPIVSKKIIQNIFNHSKSKSISFILLLTVRTVVHVKHAMHVIHVIRMIHMIVFHVEQSTAFKFLINQTPMSAKENVRAPNYTSFIFGPKGDSIQLETFAEQKSASRDFWAFLLGEQSHNVLTI